MPAESPLADRKTIRLRDLNDQRVLLPTAASGIRQMMDSALLRRSAEMDVILESDSFEFMQNFLRHEHAMFFQIPIALGPIDEDGLITGIDNRELVARPLDPADVPAGTLHLCHLKGRVLPVAAAKFLDGVITELRGRFDEVDQ